MRRRVNRCMQALPGVQACARGYIFRRTWVRPPPRRVLGEEVVPCEGEGKDEEAAAEEDEVVDPLLLPGKLACGSLNDAAKSAFLELISRYDIGIDHWHQSVWNAIQNDLGRPERAVASYEEFNRVFIANLWKLAPVSSPLSRHSTLHVVVALGVWIRSAA